MSERDDELIAALANLPSPELSEQFWEDLRARCIKAFNEEASEHPDAASDSVVLQLGPAPLQPVEADGREDYLELAPEWGAARKPYWRRPALRNGGAARPREGASGQRPRPHRFRVSLTKGIAALLAFLAGSLLLLVDNGRAGVRLMAFSPTCSDSTAPAGGRSPKDRPLVVVGVWQEGSSEARNFVEVLKRFQEMTGTGIVYTYQQTSRSLGDDLKSRVDGGCPPDVALLPSIGLLKDLVKLNEVQPLGRDARAAVAKNYTPAAAKVGKVDDVLYGVWFKAADKSMIWYRPDIFEKAGVKPPATWPELLAVADRLHQQGFVPFSVAGKDGWTITDWFENVYLATAGPELYDKLTNHEIAWTDPSVKHALATLAEIFGRPEWLAGGAEGALRKTYEQSVAAVVPASSKVAMVYEGDFVASAVNDVKAGPEGNVPLRSFDFPEIDGSKPLVAGGDVAVSLTGNRYGEKLLEFLASPEAAEIWAREGGFISPNKNVDPSIYPTGATRTAASMLTQEGASRFDMSDLLPSDFGVTQGQGTWQLFQDFLRTPRDVDGVTEGLEKAAQKSFPTVAPAPAAGAESTGTGEGS